MKLTSLFGALVIAAGLCQPSHGFEWLDRLIGIDLDNSQGGGFGPYDGSYSAGYAPYGSGYESVDYYGYAPYSTGYAPYTTGYAPYTTGYAPYTTNYAPYAAGYAPAAGGCNCGQQGGY